MVQHRAATGFTPAHSRKRAIRQHGAILQTLQIWAYILAGAGPGQRIGAYSTTARRATWTASPGIQRESKSGGTKARKNGWATTYPTSKLIPSPRITWARS